ncbi:hypothetical protein NE562_16240 [Butyricicoccus faecihominis]|uniref:hypothetical protein n=1 Tax=Butyricicoccaceae TaxID=3085642 RepID=UPI002478AA9B|nr:MULTISPECIES: hypothetical protein [Butyricicoccaceae]MCQ5131208.1 hypothetical protein [Butyricicoccus faecihominis]WNX84467.1 hypothetical protein RWV98_18130 [Agathobaculum sp. NTUH-O15-33]
MEDGISVLRVLVTTALGAVPVPNAVVTVSTPVDEAGNSTLLYSVQTDQSGMTPPMELAAPPRAASLTPGGGRPFSLYTVQVDHPDFTPLAALNVTAFSGIPAVLPITLTPLPETANTAPQQLTAETNPQALSEQEG